MATLENQNSWYCQDTRENHTEATHLKAGNQSLRKHTKTSAEAQVAAGDPDLQKEMGNGTPPSNIKEESKSFREEYRRKSLTPRGGHLSCRSINWFNLSRGNFVNTYKNKCNYTLTQQFLF